jgi:hypothetical protein
LLPHTSILRKGETTNEAALYSSYIRSDPTRVCRSVGQCCRPGKEQLVGACTHPSQERIENVADDADVEEVYDSERHLLCVACTRARDCLLVTGVRPASEFLDDLVN